MKNDLLTTTFSDAIIVSIMDTFTSVLGGVTIFAILGNAAFLLGNGKELSRDEFSKTVESSMGLAFTSYPDVISKLSTLDGAWYWPQVSKNNESITSVSSTFVLIRFWAFCSSSCFLFWASDPAWVC